MSREDLSAFRVGVVGAGVIGLASARALLARGARVAVFERDRAGRGASWAAAGMLAATAEALEDPRGEARLAALGRESLALWPDFAADVARESGRELGFEQAGSITPALDARRADELRAWAARARTLGLDAELLDGAAARACEPALSPETRLALLSPQDWRVDNRALALALADAVRRAGGTIEEGVEIVDVAPGEPARLTLRAGGAERTETFDAIVIAAGWRAAAFAAVAPALERVAPVKGQMLAVEAGARAPRHTIRGEGVYLTPRAGGRVIIGATVEPGAADTRVDADIVEELRRGAAAMLPGLAAAPVVETWAGVRPGLSGGEPGPILELAAPGVIVAAGHHRNGILLAPVTAARVAALAAHALSAERSPS